jgi:hypothetical protein
MSIDLDLFDRAGAAFARRVFRRRLEPKKIELDEDALARMLALAHQLGAAMQSRKEREHV